MKKSIALSLALLLLPSPIVASETAWTQIGPGARIRLIASDIISGGKTHAAIEIEMPETTKTYWRIPGETGIPLQFDISGAQGIKTAQIEWPFPEREKVGKFVDYVYHGHTVLPVTLFMDGPGELRASLFLGVCDEICVPVQAEFSLRLDFAKPDRGHEIRIRQALAEVPQPWTGQNDPLGTPAFYPQTGTLLVPVISDGINPDSIIVDTGDPAQLFSMPQKSPEKGIVSFQYLGDTDAFADSRSELTMSFKTPQGVFALKKTFEIEDGAP